MPTLSLEHCKPIVVWQGSGPQDVDLTFDIGGSPGGGHVDVSGGPGEMDTVCLPTGSSGTIHLPGVSMVCVHYVANEEAERFVDFTYDLALVPPPG